MKEFKLRAFFDFFLLSFSFGGKGGQEKTRYLHLYVPIAIFGIGVGGPAQKLCTPTPVL